MALYRKKPVVIEAMQFVGTNAQEILEWIGEYDPKAHAWEASPATIVIGTLEGDMRADRGDWIIRGVKGEFYPCKSDIFDETYDAA